MGHQVMEPAAIEGSKVWPKSSSELQVRSADCSNRGVQRKRISLEFQAGVAAMPINQGSESLSGEEFTFLSRRFESDMPSHAVGLPSQMRFM